ncbi:MAG: DUF6893 family small protein [Acidimicrobiia bacterium]
MAVVFGLLAALLILVVGVVLLSSSDIARYLRMRKM